MFCRLNVSDLKQLWTGGGFWNLSNAAGTFRHNPKHPGHSSDADYSDKSPDSINPQICSRCFASTGCEVLDVVNHVNPMTRLVHLIWSKSQKTDWTDVCMSAR